MFVVSLTFATNRAEAGQYMDGHNSWLRQGFEDGVFLLSGSLQPQQGGAILAHNTTLPDLQARVDADPFMAQGVVAAEIAEITPSRADDRLAFLLG
ncbi:uncharacterized protein YciI [Nitrospirillum amazonense]|uniref:Uncharacterized protein YciI n=1 Tax=Nitrospirillum amazonense TaxID=28077 RepID=A0A560FTF8_9PROT|nr:YciI family protein [Nitrospirillum amazonense]TWB24831.1 uncharacterized protein YciI [Nitrospirillum amazonense]